MYIRFNNSKKFIKYKNINLSQMEPNEEPQDSVDGLEMLCNQVENEKKKEEEAQERKKMNMNMDLKLARIMAAK